MAAKLQGVLRECSPEDAACMFNFCERFLDNIRIYDPVEKEVLAVENGSIPWQRLWFLARHSQKFIYDRGDLPSWQSWVSSVNNFENKLKWRWLHRHTARNNKPFCKTKISPYCGHEVHIALQHWINNMKVELLRGFKQVRSMAASSKRRWCNTASFVREGIRRMPELPWTPVLTDKSKGWVLMLKSDLDQLHEDTLHSETFKIIEVLRRQDVDSRRIQYFKLATSIF